MDLIEVDDLAPFASIDEAKAEAMIEDATAMAFMAAPCLAGDDLTPQQLAAAKAILRGAILRWNDIGTGGVAAQTAGPYSMSIDTRQVRRSMFWPSEITELQNICKGITEKTGAFNIDTAPTSPMLFHATFCGWAGGWCTCGAIAFDSDNWDGLSY